MAMHMWPTSDTREGSYGPMTWPCWYELRLGRDVTSQAKQAHSEKGKEKELTAKADPESTPEKTSIQTDIADPFGLE